MSAIAKPVLPEAIQRLVQPLENLDQKNWELVYRYIQYLHLERETIYRSNEQSLIQKIRKCGPSNTFWRAYEIFYRKFKEGTMTEMERQEFHELAKLSHVWEAERVSLVTQLANLRQETFEETWNSLALKPRSFDFDPVPLNMAA